MNISEYNKIKDLNYEEYCKYLQNKYGIPKKPYFSENLSKCHTITRTREGLFIHHVREDVAIMLSTEIFASINPYEYQLPENLVYCDYLEHLFLHILISEDVIRHPEKKRNEKELPGVGGVINFIGPELNDIYSGLVYSQEWKKTCANKIINDKDVYIGLIGRFIYNYWKPLGKPVDELVKSYNEQYGLWSRKKNVVINEEIIRIYNSIK